MKQHILDFLWAALAFLSGLTPAALGAAVSLMFEKGLTWSDRFMRLAVGIIVSWFAARVAGALWKLDPFVLQGISFTIGMIAFKATPPFISNASDVIAGLPGIVRDRFLPKKESGQ